MNATVNSTMGVFSTQGRAGRIVERSGMETDTATRLDAANRAETGKPV